MSLLDEFHNGHKSYYDEVPRYKNPWGDKGHYDDSEFNAWDEGWDVACKEHELFTENQQLKSEKEKYVDAIGMQKAFISILEDKIKILQNDNAFLQDVELATLSSSHQERGQKLDTIDELAHSLIGYINETKKLFFSREKMISTLKMMFKDNSPEVKKTKPK